MAEQKEIKFRDRGGFLEGRRGNLVFTLYGDTREENPEKMTYSVVVRHREIESPGMNTVGHLHFRLEEAKEFCLKIAAGEIDPEALLMEFAEEDMAKEQAAVREITEKAKKFHARLDAMGLKYRDLLELEVLAHSLGDMGHNILLGYERGEGRPEAAGQAPTEREPETGEKPYWAIYPLPEDCQSLFVFASAEQFDRCVKNGAISLHDDRDSPGEMRLPCFIGYATTKDLKCLDKLAGMGERAKGAAAHVVEVQGRRNGETGQEFVGKVKQIIQDLSESRRPFQ